MNQPKNSKFSVKAKKPVARANQVKAKSVVDAKSQKSVQDRIAKYKASEDVQNLRKIFVDQNRKLKI